MHPRVTSHSHIDGEEFGDGMQKKVKEEEGEKELDIFARYREVLPIFANSIILLSPRTGSVGSATI